MQTAPSYVMQFMSLVTHSPLRERTNWGRHMEQTPSFVAEMQPRERAFLRQLLSAIILNPGKHFWHFPPKGLKFWHKGATGIHYPLESR